MNSSIAKKAGIYIAATFILGAASGAVLGYSKGRHPSFSQPNPEDVATRVKAKFTKELSLSEEQQKQIYPIIEGTVRQVEELQRTQMTQIESVFQASRTNIAAHLDEKQKVKLEEMESRRPKFHCHSKPGQRPAGGN